MRRENNFRNLLVLVMMMLVAGSTAAFAQRSPVRKKPVIRRGTVRKTVPVPKTYAVTANTRIRARMNDTLSSKTARVGDRFTANVTEPIYSTGGVLVIPAGSTVSGRVDAVAAAQKKGKPGTISVSFTSIQTPNGYRRAINGSLTDLDSKSAKSDSEGTASGDKIKHRKLIFYGGGAGGGALLGAAIGGGKGALIGGLLGAGGGFLGERYTKGEEATVKSGTEFGVVLNTTAYFQRFAEVTP
ncbi:MAG: hypothetical protein ABI878_05440 [Acidobacteriota bacterium]